MISPAQRINQVQEYYFSSKLSELRRISTPEWPVINLGIGSPDLPPSSNTVEALVNTARQKNSHGYQSYKGIPELRKAIADFNKATYGVDLDPESMILPLMGSKEGIMHLTMAFVNPGEEVLVPDPGYPTYTSVARLVGASVRPYQLKEEENWSIDIEALRQQDLSRVKLMWINFPHMPTGTTASQEQLEALVALAREKEFLLVNDNPYSLILNKQPQSLLSVPGAVEVALELNSLSKSHNMAGWRIGWVAGHPTYLEAVLRVKSNMDSGMFLGLQHAAIEALKLGPAWFEANNQQYAERKVVGLQILELLGCRSTTDQVGMFLWAKAPDTVESIEAWVDEILYATHVFLTPGFIFGEEGSRYLRLSLCSTKEALQDAFRRVSQYLQEAEKPSIL